MFARFLDDGRVTISSRYPNYLGPIAFGFIRPIPSVVLHNPNVATVHHAYTIPTVYASGFPFRYLLMSVFFGTRTWALTGQFRSHEVMLEPST